MDTNKQDERTGSSLFHAIIESIKSTFRSVLVFRFAGHTCIPIDETGAEDHLSPAELFNELNRLFEEILQKGRKEIQKKVLVRFSLEERMRPGVGLDLLIALNLGHYMQSRVAWSHITKEMKRYDDAHQIEMGRPVRTEDELWDTMGPFLLTAMKGFCAKKGLEPRLPLHIPFVSLLP
jgi:hypothetical protein